MKKIFYVLCFLSSLWCNNQLKAQCTITFVRDVSTPSGTGPTYSHTFRLRNSSSSACNAVDYTIVGFQGYYITGGGGICALNSTITTNPSSFSVNRNGEVDVTVTYTVAPNCGAGDYKIEFSIRDGNGNALAPLPGGRLYSLFTYNCPSPSSLSVTNIGTTSATLNWSSVYRQNTYEVAYRVSGTSTWTRTGFTTGTSRTITGLFPSTSYEWKVNTACDDFWLSNAISGNSFTTQALPCNVSVTTSQSNATCGQSNGSITASGSGASSYQYRLGTGNWQSSGTFSGLAPGSYAIGVRDANNTGCSNGTNVTITSSGTTPSTPSYLDASDNNCGNITLSWENVSGVTSYKVYRNSSLFGTFTSNSATDNSPPTGSVSYSVEATNSCGTSGRAYDNGAAVAIPSCPLPGGLQANASTTSADVSWNNTSDAQSYTVYWRTIGGIWSNSPTVSGTTYTISNLQSNTRYQWYVKANCNCGISSPTPSSFNTEFTTCAPPTFTLHPQPQRICVGQSVTFRTTASNADAYKWQKYTNNSWQDVAGATSSSLTLNNVTTNDATNYRCVASRTCGSQAMSNEATLSIANNTFIGNITPSGTVTIGRGQALQLDYNADDATPPYQWTTTDGTFSDATIKNPTITFSSIPIDSHQITLVVRNQCNGTTTFTKKIAVQADIVNNLATRYPPEKQLSWKAEHLGDPINMATGAYTFGQFDLTLSGINHLRFERNYNSQDVAYNGTLGYGWRHNFDYKLDVNDPDVLTVYYGDGHRTYHVRQAHRTTRLLYRDVADSLIINPNNTYTLQQRSGGKLNFDATGKLTSMQDLWNNQILFEYTNNLLSRIVSAGRAFTLTYQNGKVSTVSDGLRTVTYTYDAAGDFKTATVNGKTTTFFYDNAHQIVHVTDAMGYRFVRNVYTNGKVTAQYDVFDKVMRFDYNTPSVGITKITNALNHVRYSHHNTNFNHVKSVDELGYIVDMEYYDNGTLKTYTDQNRRQIQIIRNYFGEPLQIKNALNRTVTTTFNSLGLPDLVTDLLQRQTRIGYDRGKPNLITLPNQSTIGIIYNAQGQPVTIRDPKGNNQTITYNAFGDAISITTPAGTFYFTYDAIGRVVTIQEGTNPQKVWRTEYNDYDQVTKVTNPSGYFIQMEYDLNGYLTRIKDLSGAWTVYTYDTKDRLRKITEPNRAETLLDYDDLDRLKELKNAYNEVIWTGTYTPRNELRTETTPTNGTTTYDRDPVGNLIKVTNALGKYATIAYNELNLPIRIEDPMRRVLELLYDEGNQLIRLKYPDGTRDTFSFNNMGWLEKVKDALNGENTFRQDLNGNTEEIKNAKNNPTTASFDDANRPLSMFDGVTRSLLTWSISGLQTVTDGNQVVSTFERNLNNEVIRRTSTDGTFEFMTLNPDGFPMTIQNQNGTTIIERDSMHFPTVVIDPYGNRIEYVWDLLHRLIRVNYPLPNVFIEITYKAGTRLPEHLKYNGTILKTYQYNTLGQLIGATLNNNTSFTQTFNDAGELVSLQNKMGNAIFQRDSLTLDMRGREQANVAQPIAPAFVMTNDSLTHGVDDGLLTRNGVTLTSDGNGNVTNLGNGTTCTWLNDRLITLNRNNTPTQYTYDAFGVKIKKMQAGVEMRYVNDVLLGGLSTPLVELNVTHNTRIINVLGAYGEPILRDSMGTKRYFHFDIHGNTVALTNETGQVTDRYATDDFGTFENHQGSSTQPFVFMGAYGVQREAENLYWVRERWLDVSLGRFLSKDPFPADFTNTQSNNRFVYALNNPSSWIDPSGLKETTTKTVDFSGIEALISDDPLATIKQLNETLDKQHSKNVITEKKTEEIVYIMVPADLKLSMLDEFMLSPAADKIVSMLQAAKDGTYIGTDFVAEASKWYEDKYTESVLAGNPDNMYLVGYGFTSMWTPESYLTTADALTFRYSFNKSGKIVTKFIGKTGKLKLLDMRSGLGQIVKNSAEFFVGQIYDSIKEGTIERPKWAEAIDDILDFKDIYKDMVNYIKIIKSR